MSRTFSTKKSSVLSVNVARLCGFRRKARQIREMVERLTPVFFSISRVDQCVASSGGRLAETVNARLQETLAPLADHLLRNADLGRNILAQHAVSAQQHDARSLCETGRHRSAMRVSLQRLPLIVRQIQRRLPAPHLSLARSHDGLTEHVAMDSLLQRTMETRH